MHEIKGNPLLFQDKSRDSFLLGEDKDCTGLLFFGGARDPFATSLFKSQMWIQVKLNSYCGVVREIISIYKGEVKKRLESPTTTELQF